MYDHALLMMSAPAHHVSCVPDDNVCEVLVCLEVAQHLAAKQLITPQLPLSIVEARVARPGDTAAPNRAAGFERGSFGEGVHAHLASPAHSFFPPATWAEAHSSHQKFSAVQ